MRIKRAVAQTSALLSIVIAFAAIGCGGQGVHLEASALPQGGSSLQAQLPQFPGRGASVATPLVQDGSAFSSKSAGASASGTHLLLPNTPKTMQYGVYTFGTGGDPVLSINVDVLNSASQYFLGLSNYATNKWQILGPFTNDKVVGMGGGNYVSPGGACTVFIATFEKSAELVKLTLTIDSAVPTFSLSGTVMEGVNGLAGADVALGGTATSNTTTDASGNYSFSGLTAGSYTVTPSKATYTFNPTSASPTISNANVTGVDFVGTTGPSTFTLSGIIQDINSAPVPGVTVTMTGDATNSTTTNASGNYSFTGVANGNYTLTPSLTGWIFNPASRPVAVTGADQTNLAFTGTPSPPGPFYSDVRAILARAGNVGCGSCHFGQSSGGVNFHTYAAITANDAFGRKVYDRIIVRAVQEPWGGMPQGRGDGNWATPAEKALIQEWVNEGALDDP